MKKCSSLPKKRERERERERGRNAHRKCDSLVALRPQLFFHGDSIPVKIKVNNETSKTIKHIKITGVCSSKDTRSFCGPLLGSLPPGDATPRDDLFVHLFSSLSLSLSSPGSVDQATDIILYSADKYTKCVLNKEFRQEAQ